MSKDKYTSVFFHEIEVTVFIIVFINILGYPPVQLENFQSCGAFRPTVYKQKNILWIKKKNI